MKVYEFKCENCGSRKYEKINETTSKCVYCGYKEEVFVEKPKEEPKIEPQPTKTTDEHEEFVGDYRVARGEVFHAFVLLLCCIFGGWFGLHRFMERKFISGIFFMLTGGFFGIGYIVDVLRYVSRMITGCNGG